jgi:hypothetical protein
LELNNYAKIAVHILRERIILHTPTAAGVFFVPSDALRGVVKAPWRQHATTMGIISKNI